MSDQPLQLELAEGPELPQFSDTQEFPEVAEAPRTLEPLDAYEVSGEPEAVSAVPELPQIEQRRSFPAHDNEQSEEQDEEQEEQDAEEDEEQQPEEPEAQQEEGHEDDAPAGLFEPQSSSQTRVYVSNLSYQATEESLADFLKGYEPHSVLIPSQSIRGFQKSLVRPLGIAYVEFKDPDVAAKAISELNGSTFMNRELKLRYHIPFKSPKEKLARGSNKIQQIQRRFTELRRRNVAVVCSGDSPEEQAHSAPEPTQREVSQTTLYVGHLPSKTTDSDLREYFQEYAPQEIIVYKHRQFNGWRLRRHVTAAVVTFPDHEMQQAALTKFDNEQFQGRYIRLAPAFEDKLSEIRAEVQRMAVEQRLPQAAANLGIYIGNNLIAMQPLQPRNKQEHQKMQDQSQCSPDQQQEERLENPDSAENSAEEPSPSSDLPNQAPQQPAVSSTKVQPLQKLQKLQMLQKLQRLHKQKQRQHQQQEQLQLQLQHHQLRLVHPQGLENEDNENEEPQNDQPQVPSSEAEQHEQQVREPMVAAA